MTPFLPQIIWIYWHQGFDDAPEVVQKCVQSWQRKNPSYEVRLLDRDSITRYVDIRSVVPERRLNKMSLAAQSDVLRISLLSAFGGIWVDSTLMCLRSLDDWLPDLSPEADLFGFSNPGPDRMISSWFLAVLPDSYLAKAWLESTIEYWSRWKWRRKYYWFHYRFGVLYNEDGRFKNHWDRVNKISADGPHHMAPFREHFFQEATAERKEDLKAKAPPVLKLTYKCLKDGYEKGTMIDYILNELPHKSAN